MTPADFPPEPWQLGGSMLWSVFALRPAELPGELATALPAGARTLRVGGRVPVNVAFVRYEPGSVLTYHELLVAVAVRRGARILTTIPHIWVDSEQSRAGGRALWGIPKHLGAFDRLDEDRRLRVAMTGEADREVASVDVRRGPRLRPGWQVAGLGTAQHLAGTDTFSTNVVRARVRGARTRWAFASDGPLGYLAGRRPLGSVELTDMGISFGVRVARSPSV